jgi:NAD+ synthetase
MKIALAQINPIVGDIAGNTAKHLEYIDRAAREGARLVVFPEMSIIGYPPKDLLLKADVIEQCERALAEIAAHCRGVATIVGLPMHSTQEVGQPLHNAAAVCCNGETIDRRFKSLLPSYDVFDENRYFEPGKQVDLSRVDGVNVGISICEDLWSGAELFGRPIYQDNPIEALAAEGAAVFVNCSASPYIAGKHARRRALLGEIAPRHGLPIVFINQVGGNDELIFDGNSCVFDGQGRMLGHAKGFAEDLLVVDLPIGGGSGGSGKAAPARIETPLEGSAAVWSALVLGIGDYARKCGFERVVLGLSGGIDSAVTACLVVAAIGAEHVTGITMPSRYSSSGSKSDAQVLAENLGITFHTIPIEGPHDAMERTLAPYFEGTDPGAAEENIQARLRGIILMAFSNKFGSLLVTTGNKSEMAVGYCTLYGDMAGGLAALSDVPKTMVYQLARYINSDDCAIPGVGCADPIPENTISKAPSAELRPDQKDSDTLPEYEVLDQIVDRYVERDQSPKRIVAETGFDAELVRRYVRLIDRNEYKRKQTPPGLKITGKAFGFGRRMPIAQRYQPK